MFRDINVPSLDFLRGAMPILVLLGHAAIWTGGVKELRPIFMGGGLAVDVFIFVSGFLMLWHYLSRENKEPWDRSSTWSVFWVRRFFRIAPLYWVVLTVMYLSLEVLLRWKTEFHALYPPPWAGRLIGEAHVDESLSAANIASHYSFLFGFIPRFASNNPLPDWSIGLEVQFYLAFPFLALAMRKLGWLIVGAGLLLVWFVAIRQIHVGLLTAPGSWGWFPMPTFLPLRIGIFLSGMLAANGLFSPKPSVAVASFIGSVAIVALHNKYLVVPIGAFVVWEWLIRGDRLATWMKRPAGLCFAFLKSKIIKFAADCSYGVYLWHMLVQLVLMRILVDWGVFAGRGFLWRFAVLSLLCLPVVYLIAWASYCWVELPGIQLGKAVIKRRKKLVEIGG